MIHTHTALGKNTRILLGALAALGLSGLATPSAFAVSYTLVPSLPDGTQLDWNTNANWSPATGSPGSTATADIAIVSGAFGGVSQTVDISATPLNAISALTLGDTSGTGTTTIKASNSSSLSLASGASITSAGTAGAGNIISAPISYAGGLNFLAGTNNLAITGKLTPTASGAKTITNSSGQTVTLGDIDLSVGGTASAITIRNDNNVANNKLILAGTIADGSTVASSLIIGSRAVTGSVQIDGTNTYTGATTLGVQGVKSLYLINSDQPFGPASGGTLTIGGPSNAVNNLEAMNADRTITKNAINIQRGVAAQGSNSLTLAGTTITANSSLTITNDIGSGETLTLGVAGGAYNLNNNATDKNRITTFAGAGTTIVASNLADNAGAIAADSKNAIAMNGTGKLILAGTNTYQGGTRITSTGVVQLGDGGASGSLEPGNGLTPVVTGTAAGTLAFKRSDDVTSAITANGLIGISQVGSGSVTLTNSQFNTGSNSVGDGVTASKLVVTGGLVSAAFTTTNAGIAAVSGAPGMVVTLNGADTTGTLNLKVGQPVYLTSGGASAASYIHSITDSTHVVIFGTGLLSAGTVGLTFGEGSALGASTATTTVNNLATLAGTGVISGAVNALAGSHLAPGLTDGATGTLTTGALTLTGADLAFDLASTSAGVSDEIHADSLSFNLLSFTFDALTAGVLETGVAYDLISGAGLFTGDVNQISTTFGDDLLGLYTATYSLKNDGGLNILDVTFAAIPEPSSAAALLGVACLAGVALRRRRSRA